MRLRVACNILEQQGEFTYTNILCNPQFVIEERYFNYVEPVYDADGNITTPEGLYATLWYETYDFNIDYDNAYKMLKVVTMASEDPLNPIFNDYVRFKMRKDIEIFFEDRQKTENGISYVLEYIDRSKRSVNTMSKSASFVSGVRFDKKTNQYIID